MFGGLGGLNFSSFNMEEKHPQVEIIKKHIERAVQDLFLESLRKKNDDLVHIFSSEEQIDVFIQRVLKYWEDLEDYEVCKEVVELTTDFKEKWKNRDTLEESSGLTRLKNLFNQQK